MGFFTRKEAALPQDRQTETDAGLDPAQAMLQALDRSLAVIEFGLDGTIVTANQNFLGLMGYTLDEIRGRHHSLFAEPGFAASADYRDFWARLNRGEFQRAQY